MEWPDTTPRVDGSQVLGALNERDLTILVSRLGGETLRELGTRFGMTHERVRQLQERANTTIRERLRADVVAELGRRLDSAVAVSDAELGGIILGDSQSRAVVLTAVSASQPRTWAGLLDGWWTRDTAMLRSRLERLIEHAPFHVDELRSRAESCELPEDLPLTELFSHPRSPLVLNPSIGWARRTGAKRDLAFLWLNDVGEPRPAEEIAEAVGAVSGRALGEAMRRDDRFIQIRPEGAWAVSDWKGPGTGARYTNAEEVVLEILRDDGAMSESELIAEARRRYPVSVWRYTQVLSSNRIGVTSDGLFDLAERGATPVEDKEPRRPENMQANADGTLIGVRLTVDRDVLRGSGINVNRWLSWKLGLRTAPTERRFAMDAFDSDLVVRRNMSTTALSSLRAVVNRMGLGLGCEIVVILRLRDDSAGIRHVCSSCAAGAAQPER
jgi:hypothetical protein